MKFRRRKDADPTQEKRWGNGFSDGSVPPPNYGANNAGVSVTPHEVAKLSSVHRALEIITSAFLTMGDPAPYQIGYHGDSNRPYRMWLNPTTMSTPPTLLTSSWGPGVFQSDGMDQTLISMAIFGESFWLVTSRNFYLRATSLEVLNPIFVHEGKDAMGMPTYSYGMGAERRPLPPEDVVHIRGITMPGARRSQSSITHNSLAFSLALAAIDYTSRWYSQGASPQLILSATGKVGNDELNAIADRFLINHAGLSSAHLPLVIDNGMTVAPVSSGPDLASVQILEVAQRMVASYFGLPSSLMGIDSGAATDTAAKTLAEENLRLLIFTLNRYITKVEQAFSSLLPNGTYAGFFTDTLLRVDGKDLAAEITALRTSGVITKNEGRLMVGLGPSNDPTATALEAPLNSNAPSALPAPDSTESDPENG